MKSADDRWRQAVGEEAGEATMTPKNKPTITRQRPKRVKPLLQQEPSNAFPPNCYKLPILSVDPDSQISSWAYFVGGELDRTGIVDHRKCTYPPDGLNTPISQWAILLGGFPDLFHVVVEGQFMGINAQSMMRLVEMRTTVQCACDLVGVSYQTVLPGVWQTAILARGFFTAKRKERKELSIQIASMRTGIEIDDDGIADAVCIGLWWLDQVKAGKRQEIGKR